MRVPKRHLHPLLARLLGQFLCWGISGSAVQHRNTPQYDHRDRGHLHSATFRSATERRQQSGNLSLACADGQQQRQFWRPRRQEATLHLLRTLPPRVLPRPDVPEVPRRPGHQPGPRPVHLPAELRLLPSSEPEEGRAKVRGRVLPSRGQEWVREQLLRVGVVQQARLPGDEFPDGNLPDVERLPPGPADGC